MHTHSLPLDQAAAVLDQDDDSLYPELLDEPCCPKGDPSCEGGDEDCHDECVAPFSGPWCVCVFLVDRAYGGPEEGGWWFDCGEPQIGPDMPLPEFYPVEDAAIAAREKMDAEIERLKLNEGRREISSVLSEGRYRAVICEGWPKPYPDKTPHYE